MELEPHLQKATKGVRELSNAYQTLGNACHKHAVELQRLLDRLEPDHPARARIEARLLEAKGGPPATETLTR